MKILLALICLSTSVYCLSQTNKKYYLEIGGGTALSFSTTAGLSNFHDHYRFGGVGSLTLGKVITNSNFHVFTSFSLVEHSLNNRIDQFWVTVPDQIGLITEAFYTNKFALGIGSKFFEKGRNTMVINISGAYEWGVDHSYQHYNNREILNETYYNEEIGSDVKILIKVSRTEFRDHNWSINTDVGYFYQLSDNLQFGFKVGGYFGLKKMVVNQIRYGFSTTGAPPNLSNELYTTNKGDGVFATLSLRYNFNLGNNNS